MADENKVVSISFNNKQFMEDVEDTIDAVRRLNDATSGKHAINVSGFREINSELENLTKNLEETVNISSDSFSNIGKAAYNSVADINELKTSTDSLSTSFNSLQVIGLGALLKIGETVATTSMQISNALFNTLTRGIRDGWQEYNILIDSTQTISTNVQRFGSDLDDVTDALDRLNDYADLTIYNFGQMTRNIGYFTAAGSNLEDSVVAVQGLMNVAAFFGVQNEQAQRAAYQMSQFMARGTMNLMDWRSMVNAGMGGDALKRELVTIGATIGGYSQEWADEVMANFEDSLREGWLTSDIFLEAMARFQGSRDRAYYESIFDEEGHRVYEEDEINRLLALGDSALEAAQKVRTFKQMMDAVGESIGSGWGRIFRTIIGDLEEAKEFWSPINDLITGVIGKTMDYIAGIAEGWAKFGRSTMIQDMMYGLEGISKVLGVLGQAFENVFGSTGSISGDLLRLTIHIGDFVEAMALTDEEAEDLRDIFEALLMPFGLLIDLIKSLTLWLFDGGDAMEQVYRNTSDTYSGLKEFRKALLWVVGSIARVVKRIGEFVRQIKIIPKAVNVIGSIIKTVFGGLSAIITAPFIALYNVWEKYNITDKLLIFAQNMYNRFVEPIKNGILELVSIFDTFKTRVSRVFSALNIDGFTVLSDALSILKQLFSDILDPTVSFQEAFDNFTESIGNSSVGTVIDVLRQSLSDLWASIRNSTIGQWFENAGSRIQIFWDAVRNSSIGDFIQNIADRLSELTGIDSSTIYHVFEEIKNGISLVGDVLLGSALGVGEFISNLASVVRSLFETEDEMADPNGGALVSGIEALNDAVRGTDSRKFAQIAEDTKALVNAFGGNTKGDLVTTPWIVTFLDTIKEKFDSVKESISGSEIVQKLRDVISWIAAPFEYAMEDEEDWSDKAIRFAKFIEKIGQTIETIKNVITSVAIGAIDSIRNAPPIPIMLANMFVMFADQFKNIDPKAMDNILKLTAGLKAIIDSIAGILIAVISLKISTLIEQVVKSVSGFFNGMINGAVAIGTAASKASIAASQAAKQIAVADTLKTIALMFVLILGVVALIIVSVKNGYISGGEIALYFGAVVLMLVALGIGLKLFLSSLVNVASPASKSIGVFKSISRMLTSIAYIILSIGAIIGLVVLSAAIISKNYEGEEYNRFLNIISDIGGFLFGIGIAIGILLAVCYGLTKSISKNQNAVTDFSKTISAISMIMFSVSALLSVFTLAVYVLSKIPKEDSGRAMLQISILLGEMTIIIAAIMLLCSQLSEKLSKLQSSKLVMATAIAIIGIFGILAAIAAFVGVVGLLETYMTYVIKDDRIGTLIASGVIVAILFVGLSKMISLLINRIDAMGSMAFSRNPYGYTNILKTVFNGLSMIMLSIVGFIAALAVISSIISRSSNTTSIFVGIGLIGIIISGIILSFSALLKQMNNFEKVNTGAIITIAIILGEVLIAVIGISHVLNKLASTISDSTSFSLALMATSLIILSVMAILELVSAVIKNAGSVNVSQVISIFGGFGILIVGILGISSAIAWLSTIPEQRLTKATNSLFKLTITVSVVYAIFAVIAQLGGNAPALVAAGGGFAIACLGLLVLAQAIAQLANIDVGKLEEARLTMLSMALVVTAIMAVMAIISGTGYGAAAIGLAAAAMLSMAASVFIMSGAIEITATGVDKLATALDRLSHIDMRPLALNFIALIQTIPMIFEALKSVSPSIIGIVGLVMDVVAAIITAQIGIIGKVIMNEIDAWLNYIESKVGQIYRIMNLLMYGNGSNGGLIHMILQGTYTLFFDESYGVLKMIDEFVLAVIEMIPGWIKAIIDVIANEFSSDESQHTIGNALGRLLENIQAWVFEKLGVDSWEDVGLSIMKKILLGAMNGVEQGIEWILENAPEALGGVSLWFDLASRPDMSDQYYESGVSDSEAYVEGLRTGYSSMDSYYANMYSQQETRARSMADVISDVFSNLGGNGGGIGSAIQNGISSILGSFGVDTSGGILSGVVGSIGNALGIDLSGGLGGLLGNVFGGFNMGSMFGGVDTSTLTAAGDMFGNASTLDPNSLNAFTGAVSSVGDAWSDGDVTSPVITPTVDTSQVSLGINDIENMFADAEIDTIAVDASGSFMTGSYGGSTDQATNGMSVINFTQYNTSPRDLSRIEIYRDTQNAIRSVT